MTPEDLISTLSESQPPVGLSPVLQGLWHDAKGNWADAHDIAQGGEGTAAFDRLHAYLHRKEGDTSNAGYWYRRAKTQVFDGTLEQEWKQLVTDLSPL